jgi:hypothetical protein
MPKHTWSERIPAAIAKAERRMGSGSGSIHYFLSTQGPDGAITASEVALAKALWETESDATELLAELDLREKLLLGAIIADNRPALRAFCEKVEAL